MKKTVYSVLLTAIFAFCAAGVNAQMKTSYFMEGSIPRYDMNAALTPGQGYVNFPLLPIGAFGFNMNNNFLSIGNFIYKGPGGGHVTFMHPSVSAEKFLRRIPAQPGLNMDMNYNLLGFGKYNKKRNYFWSFGWNLRVMADMDLSKDLFRFVKDTANGTYDLSDISAGMDAYTEFAFGFAMPVAWQNMTVGGRLKLLMGLAQIEAMAQNATIDVGQSSVTARANAIMRASVFGKSYAHLRNGATMDFGEIFDIDPSAMLSNGFKSWGAAIDLGAEAKLFDKRLKLSIGVNDLGFIRWSGANSIMGELSEPLQVEFTGYDLDNEKWNMEENTGDIRFLKTGSDSYFKRLSTTLNVGAEYNFFDNLLGVGLLSHTKLGTRFSYSELTLIGTVRPARWFTASISQSMIHNKIGIFGFAFNFHPRGFNFFTGVDYIPTRMASLGSSLFGKPGGAPIMFPAHAKSLNVYFGLAFGIGRQKPW